MDLFPLIWDFRTSVRLVALSFSALAWAWVGWNLAPILWRWWQTSTNGYVDWMMSEFDRMFIEVPRWWCTASIAVSVTLFAALGFLLTSGIPWSPGYHVIRALVVGLLAVGPFGMPTGFNLPRFVVARMWEKRILDFEDQMLDALAFMSNGLKSGLSLLQSMDMVREELPNPISQEFALTLNEQRLGVPLEDALLNLEKRIGTEDIQIVVTSINILRQSGGNLAETFDTVANTIRERKKVEGKVRSLTAQGVAQGVIIVCMPFVLAFALWMMDPVLISRLWTTALGWALIFLMLTLQVIGGTMIRRIVKVQV
ncbi:MAG: type II secretion system F family protein [Deltaproteobacteria bacterium]|nr:type II secretion system F family protein [Deltaproteobacteria bacterium]